MGKVIFIWEYSENTEYSSGIAYLPRTVTVNLPCKTSKCPRAYMLYLKKRIP